MQAHVGCNVSTRGDIFVFRVVAALQTAGEAGAVNLP